MIPLAIVHRLLEQLGAGEIDFEGFVEECEHWRALCSEVLGW